MMDQVQGVIIFNEEYPLVHPLTHLAKIDLQITDASRRLITLHKNGFPVEKILCQRHHVRVIPIAEVEYRWKLTNGYFYVYGDREHRVQFDDYPDRRRFCRWFYELMTKYYL